MTKCRSCNAEIMWKLNNSSRQIAPIDAEPSDQGNIRSLLGGEYAVLTGAELTEARQNGEKLHTNHFQTCTNPKDWKRGTKKPLG